MVRKNSAPSEQSWQILKDPELPPPSNITLPTNNHLHKLAVISPLGDCNHLLTGLNTPYHRFSPNHASHQRAGILASTNPIASWSQLHPGSPFLPTRGRTCMGIPHLEGPLPPFPREHLIIQFHHSPHFSDPFPDFNACEKPPPPQGSEGCSGSWLMFFCATTRFMPVSPHSLRNSGRLFTHHCIPRAMLIAWHSTDIKYLLHRKSVNAKSYGNDQRTRRLGARSPPVLETKASSLLT